MQRLLGIAIDRPRLALAVFGLAFAFTLPGLARLHLRTDGRALVPADAPAVREDRSIREEFGVRDLLVAVVETSDSAGVFNPRTLEHVAALTRDLQAIPLVRPEDVTSLATEPGDHVRTGTLDFRTWLDPLPKTPEESSDLRRRLARAPIYSGTLLSFDTPPSATAILIGVEDGIDRDALVRGVRSAVEARPSHRPTQGDKRDDWAGDRVLLAGAPLAESQLGEHLLGDLALLVPVAFAVMGAILFLSWRSAGIALLLLSGVGTCLLATFGLMGWCGAPVYLTCLVVPVVLTAVGAADSIHVYDQYLHLRRQTPTGDPREAVRAALCDMGRAVINTSVTTAIGFLSFAISPIAPMRVFGLATAAGVMLCMLWSLTVLPASLALFGNRIRVARGGRDGASLRERTGPAFAAWARLVRARGRAVLLGSAVLVLLSAWGASRLRIQDSWIEGFASKSELRRHTRIVDELFGGTHLLRVRLATDTASASGRVDLARFDNSSLLLSSAQLGPSVGAPPGAFVGQRLALKPVNVPGGVPSWPQELRVTDAREEGGGVRLFLASPRLPSTPLRDLLPPGVLEFDFETDAQGRLVEPEMLAHVRALEDHLAAMRSLGVGAVLGPWSHLTNLNAMIGAEPERALAILAERKGIDRTLQLYRTNRGERRMQEVFSRDLRRGLVTVLLKNASYASVGELLSDIRAYEGEHLAPRGIRVDLGGDLALSQAMIDGIVRTQMGSLALSLLGVLVVAALVTRSFIAGLACAVPCAAAALATFGAMGAVGIPLGVATSMFAGIAIGVGDDYAIHLWERLRRSLDRGEEIESAIADSMADVGPGILVDALAVGAGFSVLILSQVPTDAHLGALLVLSIAGCLAASLTLLPPLLSAGARAAARRGPARKP